MDGWNERYIVLYPTARPLTIVVIGGAIGSGGCELCAHECGERCVVQQWWYRCVWCLYSTGGCGVCVPYMVIMVMVMVVLLCTCVG